MQAQAIGKPCSPSQTLATLHETEAHLFSGMGNIFTDSDKEVTTQTEI